MIKSSLRAFVESVLVCGRIAAADVSRLQRHVLPDGPMSREEVDLLIALDRAVATSDMAWTNYLVATIAEFAVWTTRPTGRVTGETARWLLTALASAGRQTRIAARVARAIAAEADEVDEALLALARGRMASGAAVTAAHAGLACAA